MIAPDALSTRMIALASGFVGMVETQENARWDDPRTAFRDLDKESWLRSWMEKISGWTPGAPYCVAFDGAIAACALYQLSGGIMPTSFLAFWTAHVMTNVRALRDKGLLSSDPVPGAIWLARHGGTDSGHAELVCSVKSGMMSTIGANTSAGATDDPELQRAGDGIFVRLRAVRGEGSLETQGFATPASILKLAGL